LSSFFKFTKFISSLSDRSFITFKNREVAGESLSHLLKKLFKEYSNDKFIILCIPRGGVIIGDVIARNFRCKLDIILSSRLKTPLNKESSFGSILRDGTIYLDKFLIDSLKISNEYIENEKKVQIKEIKRKEAIYGKLIEGNKLKSKNIILVDDGAATGSTLIVVSKWIKTFQPNHLTIAIPICPKEKLKLLKNEANDVKSLINPLPHNFTTLSKFYQDFSPVNDDQIINILKLRK
jgi:predicted phosphoribosyltransferase